MTPAIARSGAADYETTILIGDHRLTADAKPDSGGGDTGPEPHDLLAAALASCTSVTLRMYAKRKGWDVSGLEVSVLVERTAAGETTFRRSLLLPGALDAASRERLVQIANACPVHRILAGSISIETSELAAQPERARG